MEQVETNIDKIKNSTKEEDCNILAVFPEANVAIDDSTKNRLRELVLHAFDYLSGKEV